MKLSKEARAKFEGIKNPSADAQNQIHQINVMNEELNTEAVDNIRSTVTIEGITITTNGHNQVLDISGEGITPEMNDTIQFIFMELTRLNSEKMKNILIEKHCKRLGVNSEEVEIC